MNRAISGSKIALAVRTQEDFESTARRLLPLLVQMLALLLLGAVALAQETTGGLQGTVKDSAGALVLKAHVVVVGASLTGQKAVDTDNSGYYRFANLPPGRYTITVTASGFKTAKREGLLLEVGHLPSIDFALEVGSGDTVIEVSGAAPVIDVTTETTQTNITLDVINDVPHGRSFQSMIEFAPSARNEPLQGSNILSNGTGGSSPGNGSNGGDHGFSVAGGSDSENSYLVEGQETANLIGGYSHTNVPFEFIQEVQVKSSGIEAEHGGALGGVVNVIMKKGSNAYHGSIFTEFENDAMDGAPTARSRYDESKNGTRTDWGRLDPAYHNYQPVNRKTSDVAPGAGVSGPIIRDKVFFFLGFNPEWNNQERRINYGPTNGGIIPFSQNQQTYYTSARVDASITKNIRVYGSWLYQYQRESGHDLPRDDSTAGYFNPASGIPKFVFAHSLGYAAPNSTTNVGADITLTPHLVATTRFGYYFENYHDFGYQTSGSIVNFGISGQGATDSGGITLLPQALQHSAGYFNVANNQNYTVRNANKGIQYDADVAWFKSGWKGTHNFKFGYQLNRLSNDIGQRWNAPYVQIFPGPSANAGSAYSPATDVGEQNCAALEIKDGTEDCQGRFGYLLVQDFGTLGKATSFNHGLFAQDAWTIGHGITINAGVRFDKEYLPGEAQGAGVPSHPINFSWTDKIAPRIGAAWDVFKDGRMKVFGGYGVFYDIMKLNLAISSFGGQYWQNCYYGLDTANLDSIVPVYNSAGRDCIGASASSQANWAGGVTPAGLTFLENQNFRTFPTTCATCNDFEEGVAPGLKPYRQHESVFGVDYQLAKNLAFEARWDRRRLDHVIEDSSIFNQGSETFVIVNPGQGINRTFEGFCNFLYGADASAGCAPSPGGNSPPSGVIPAARSYDGVEFRVIKSNSQHWFGMFSYTYSRLRGNYTGLTSSDIADGLYGGRNSPNNNRSFDESYFSWNSFGGSSSGLLPTDRPNAFKGYAYYELPWSKFSRKLATNFGIFQYAYSGAPATSFVDVGFNTAGSGFGPVDVVNRGKWVDVTQDPVTGVISVGAPRTFRAPWYTQTDFNLKQSYKISEEKTVSFSATFANLLNQHSTLVYNGLIDSANSAQYVSIPGSACQAGLPGQCFLGDGTDFYAAAQRPYNLSAVLNSTPYTNRDRITHAGRPITVNSQYGKPLFFQLARTIRLGLKFTF